MAVKGKVAKFKHNNQKRSKPVKLSKTIKHGTSTTKLKPLNKKFKSKKIDMSKKTVETKNPGIIAEESDDDQGEEMLKMMEDDDILFLKKAVTDKSYSLLNKIRYGDAVNNDLKPKAKKRKINSNEEYLESNYQVQEEDQIKFKNLLPIKTKKGVVPVSVLDESENYNNEEGSYEEQSEESDDDDDGEENEEFVMPNIDIDLKKPISTAEMLATRNEILRNKKIQIGILCAGLLENPEERLTNFRNLLQIINDGSPEIYFTVRKIAIVSLLEVFKDLLPLYQIKQQESGDVRLKKDTFKLQKYETALLQYYKSYLQRLEKFTKKLIRKKGDNRKLVDDQIKLGEVSLHAMCDLIISHPYFNFAQNIAQVVVPFLNHRNPEVRKIINETCKTVFKQDKKGEITLIILRIINQYLKKHQSDVYVDMLQPLLALRIREVNLDKEKEQEIKQKKLDAHKSRILQLSRNEKKRKKRLKEIETEMLETRAEENKQVKEKHLTEITKVVFGIYFKILKTTKNSKILGVCLEGLAKYTHCINLEFYTDLVNVLNNLLHSDWLGDREQLHCIRTVLIILGGQGDVLNIDPTRFYTYLYKSLSTVNAAKHQNALLVVETLTEALIKRRKKITNKRLVGFVKRICTCSLHMMQNGTLGYLALAKTAMQLCNAIDILLDFDTSVGDGNYAPELDDPEYCNASSSSLYELIPLTRHYNPMVVKYAKHIARRVPSTGEGSLPPLIGKCTPQQLFEEFDPNVGFNPPIPVPKKCQPKAKPGKFQFLDYDFKKECRQTLRNSDKNFVSFYIDDKNLV